MSDGPDQEEARRRAVALRYQSDSDHAPRVIAKGSGYLADRIIELAKEHHIHVHEDPELVEILARLEVDTEIPESLYRAVAEVLAFVYRLDQRMSSR